jgi:hypothetical protein
MRSKDWTLLLGVLLSCKTKLEGPFEVREGASDLLFTWIDARGDYHVDQAERDVPIASRQVVRVVDPKRDDGSHDDKVYLVDLTARSPSGLYPVHSAPLKEFEAIANARRSKQSSVPQQLPPVATGPSMAPVKDEGAGASAPVVIIYGRRALLEASRDPLRDERRRTRCQCSFRHASETECCRSPKWLNPRHRRGWEDSCRIQRSFLGGRSWEVDVNCKARVSLRMAVPQAALFYRGSDPCG